MGSHTLSTRSSLPYLGHIRYDNRTAGPCIIYKQIVIDVYVFSIIKLKGLLYVAEDCSEMLGAHCSLNAV